MKINIEIEVPDDFEPCTYGCEMHCPFGHISGDCLCVNMYYSDDCEWTCVVNETMKKGNKDE